MKLDRAELMAALDATERQIARTIRKLARAKTQTRVARLSERLDQLDTGRLRLKELLAETGSDQVL